MAEVIFWLFVGIAGVCFVGYLLMGLLDKGRDAVDAVYEWLDDRRQKDIRRSEEEE